ncbi:MAG: hypothetical protein KA313_10870 [Pseudarcicella sp.]|nr:hypothetical protein [Pseudarcicella sp.]
MKKKDVLSVFSSGISLTVFAFMAFNGIVESIEKEQTLRLIAAIVGFMGIAVVCFMNVRRCFKLVEKVNNSFEVLN